MTSKAAVVPGSASYANVAGEVPTSYSEVSALQGAQVPDGVTPPYDTPGTFAAWTTTPLGVDGRLGRCADTDAAAVVTAVAQTQAAGPAGQLLLFAKIYDVAPDGTKTLVTGWSRRRASPTSPSR